MTLLLTILLAFFQHHVELKPQATFQCADVGFGTVQCNGSVR